MNVLDLPPQEQTICVADDNFAHSYTVMLCAHLVLANLNEAIVFVSIIILLNYMILALV